LITIEECKKILNNGKKQYDKEQVKMIQEYLYLLAKIQLETEKFINNEKITDNE